MPQPKIHNAMELEALVQQMGFLPFFSCAIPNFSIKEFTPSRYWFVEDVDGPWEWRMELARRGVVAYGKLFAKKAGLVSREWYPDLANYRRNGYDFDARYAVTEDVLGPDMARGAYNRDPEESKVRIIQHLSIMCPEAFDDDLEKLIQ